MEWTVVVPVKRLAVAKSRLLPGAEPDRIAALALAFATDTVAAALGAPLVGRVVVVTGDGAAAAAVSALGAVVRPDAVAAGLNAALREGAAYAVGVHGPHPVAALLGDLPALRPAELDDALAAAGAHPAAFVADADGTGTTLLTARLGGLLPRYGPGSAAAHAAAGAAALAGDWPGLRRDVDTAADLDVARTLGLGPATSAVLADAGVLGAGCR